MNHTLTIEQKVNIRLNEFRRRLYKEIGFIEFAFSLATYISNIFFGVILILPFLYVIKNFLYLKNKKLFRHFFILKILMSIQNMIIII